MFPSRYPNYINTLLNSAPSSIPCYWLRLGTSTMSVSRPTINDSVHVCSWVKFTPISIHSGHAPALPLYTVGRCSPRAASQSCSPAGDRSSPHHCCGGAGGTAVGVDHAAVSSNRSGWRRQTRHWYPRGEMRAESRYICRLSCTGEIVNLKFHIIIARIFKFLFSVRSYYVLCCVSGFCLLQSLQKYDNYIP